MHAIHADDRPAVMRAWNDAAARGSLEVEHRVWRAAEGAWLWHHTRALPVRNSAGDIVEWLGTSTDVQQLKQMQDRQAVRAATSRCRSGASTPASGNPPARRNQDFPDVSEYVQGVECASRAAFRARSSLLVRRSSQRRNMPQDRGQPDERTAFSFPFTPHAMGLRYGLPRRARAARRPKAMYVRAPMGLACRNLPGRPPSGDLPGEALRRLRKRRASARLRPRPPLRDTSTASSRARRPGM